MPRFDSGAFFAALLGQPTHGRWLVAPKGEARPAGRRYRDSTLILETDFETDDGAVRVIDFMPPRQRDPDVVRIVQGLKGHVEMRMELIVRFDYGSIVPWVRRIDDATACIAGPDGLCLRTPVETRGEDLSTVADFAVSEGEQVPFVLTWYPSNEPLPREIEPGRALVETQTWWRQWTDACTYEGPWRDEVLRSLIVLKALTYEPTGGIVAAPTTSLPEFLGGVRNWDYRYCWLRDAAFTLDALLEAGFTGEARTWRDWLLRTIAGDPADLQIMYGVAGERRLTEFEVPWLPGYLGAQPVRIGNAACNQKQLDVYGEVMDALYHAEELGLEAESRAWAIQKKLLDHLESEWREPDNGIWEVRGPRRHFTHSKVMAWLAADRAARAVHSHADGSVDRWRRLRQEIHEEVLRQGFDPELNSFVQFYGAKKLDASLLLMPLVGFLPPSDERVRGTVEAIERDLCANGFVMRYRHDEETARVDGLPPGEGAFLPCTFWLADNLNLIGRHDDAVALFDRLLGLRNDVGLISEEYDSENELLVGNFPQAFTHVELVNTAMNLSQPSDRPLARWERFRQLGAKRN
jgi:GH15 family glucan-1,4-alpha-glucosidase